MPSHARLIWSIFKRNFVSYFINPTGYVFITVFILLGAIAAFWHPTFFLNNLANLDSLNAFYPILLLFFVPALTMNVWSEERRLGTDELLFTLPGKDIDIVLGKYGAVLGIYSVAVLFSLSHVIILAWLGEPDIGLMGATYLGYWLSGAALLAVAMIASLLTTNATVAFIVGALLCSVFVFIDQLDMIFANLNVPLVSRLGIRQQFEPFGDGVIPFAGIVYFLALTFIAIYANVALLNRRHTKGGPGSANHTLHLAVRCAALVVAAVSLFLILGRSARAVDATAEELHTLQQQTRDLIGDIPEDRPVFIQAYFSDDVPELLVQTRKNLLNTLRRFDDIGGSHVQVVVHEVEPYTEIAADAAENFGITSRPVFTQAGSQRSTVDVFLGLVFTSGPNEFVIPFFDVGLPVEYELARSIQVVTRAKQKKIGIVTTDANIFGGFDFQNMSSRPDWSIVTELRKQYNVEQVSPDGPYPADLDALLAVMPSTLTQPQLDTLQDAIRAGTPALLLDDPLPMFNPQVSPRLGKDASRNPFTSQNQPPSEPKGSFDSFLAAFGLLWNPETIIWTATNPHPSIADASPEIIFLTENATTVEPFNTDSSITAGLQEVVAIYSGSVRRSPTAPDTLIMTPLLRTGTDSGTAAWTQLLQMNIFGVQMNPNPRRNETGERYTLAMHVNGHIEGPMPTSINMIFVPDADIVSELFFDFRRRGSEEFNFDNVSFALNCIDVLAGDESFVELRKHRPQHRILTRVEEQASVFEQRRREEIDRAESNAAEQLAQAQLRLNEKVQRVQERNDLDEQAKAVMVRNVQNVENRRLRAIEAQIEQEKQQAIDRARTELEQGVSRIQRSIKLWAAVLPPIPTLLLAIGLFAYRFNRERISTADRAVSEQQS